MVARDDPKHLVGMIRRSDIVRAYELALTKRTAMRHQAHQVRLGAFGEVNVEELEVSPGSPVVGKRIRDIPWPRDAVLATIRRGRHTVLPHGDTVLKAGDIVVAVVEGDAVAEIEHLCREPKMAVSP